MLLFWWIDLVYTPCTQSLTGLSQERANENLATDLTTSRNRPHVFEMMQTTSHSTPNYTPGKTATEMYTQRILLYVAVINVMLIHIKKKKRKKMFESCYNKLQHFNYFPSIQVYLRRIHIIGMFVIALFNIVMLLSS